MRSITRSNLLFIGPLARPERQVAWLAWGIATREFVVERLAELEQSEQVLEANALDEAVAFQIEKEIPGRRLGQRFQAHERWHRSGWHTDRLPVVVAEQPIAWRSVRAPSRLQRGLLAQATERLQTLQREVRWRSSKRLQGRELRFLEAVALAARDVGHERQVIVGSTLVLTALPPRAGRAMLDGLGVGQRCFQRHERFETLPDTPVIGEVIGNSERDRLPLAAGRDVQRLG
jgi:hypothetical protein